MRYICEEERVLILFQFQDGSIKWMVKELAGPTFTPFQFQDGSIKWILNSMHHPIESVFQFQDGSIKWKR